MPQPIMKKYTQGELGDPYSRKLIQNQMPIPQRNGNKAIWVRKAVLLVRRTKVKVSKRWVQTTKAYQNHFNTG